MNTQASLPHSAWAIAGQFEMPLSIVRVSLGVACSAARILAVDVLLEQK
jgi:hypothetical protein